MDHVGGFLNVLRAGFSSLFFFFYLPVGLAGSPDSNDCREILGAERLLETQSSSSVASGELERLPFAVLADPEDSGEILQVSPSSLSTLRRIAIRDGESKTVIGSPKSGRTFARVVALDRGFAAMMKGFSVGAQEEKEVYRVLSMERPHFWPVDLGVKSFDDWDAFSLDPQTTLYATVQRRLDGAARVRMVRVVDRRAGYQVLADDVVHPADLKLLDIEGAPTRIRIVDRDHVLLGGRDWSVLFHVDWMRKIQRTGSFPLKFDQKWIYAGSLEDVKINQEQQLVVALVRGESGAFFEIVDLSNGKWVAAEPVRGQVLGFDSQGDHLAWLAGDGDALRLIRREFGGLLRD